MKEQKTIVRQPSAPATTTVEQDRHSHGQRQINLTWEVTQAVIAMSITLATIFGAVKGVQSDTLQNGFFLIVGFYFGRTNHARAGGVVDENVRLTKVIR
jgi:hypothetical protein